MEFKSIEESNGIITEEKGNQTEINEIEQNKVRLMRTFVEREDPSVKVPSFFTFSSFEAIWSLGFFLRGLVRDMVAGLYLIMCSFCIYFF